jgi:hypothetical protein
MRYLIVLMVKGWLPGAELFIPGKRYGSQWATSLLPVQCQRLVTGAELFTPGK